MIPRLNQNEAKQLPLQKSSTPLRLLKSSTEPANSNEIWLLTLSDLLMLLMIFFVFLLAVPFVQADKSPSSQPSGVTPEKSMTSAVGPAIDKTVNQNAAAQEKQTTARLEDDLHGLLGSQEGVTVKRRSQFIVITFPEQILFDSGQARMKATVGPTLGKVAVFIMNHPELSVEVQGHTDDRPIRSSQYPSNWELSADRATQVAKMLVALGANPEQIATKGFGEYHPISPNQSDADRLKNRRVEIQFTVLQS